MGTLWHHTGVGAHGNPGGGSNGNTEGLQRFGEEVMENVLQQTFGSPSPLLDTSGQTSDLYGQAGLQNPWFVVNLTVVFIFKAR